MMRRMNSLACAVLVAILVAGCVPSEVDTGLSPDVTLIVGARGLTVNPYSPLTADRQIGRLLFRGLLTVGSDGLPAPDLALEVPTAANGGISGDGKTVVFRLRDDARWHDGEPVTAEDVAFTWDLIARGVVQDDPSEDVSVVESVTASGPYEVTVLFRTPDSVFAWRMVPYVLPEHLLGDSPDVLSDAYWWTPIGCGDYRAQEVRRDGSLVLVPADDGSQAPQLNVVPVESEADGLRVFDEVDRAVWLGTTVDLADAMESEDTTWGPIWRRVVVNTTPGTVFADIDMRRAVAAALVQSVPETMPPSAWPYGAEPPSVSVADTSTAAAIFQSEGWRYVGGSRVRSKNGEDLAFTVSTPPFTQAEGDVLLPLMGSIPSSSGCSFQIVGSETPYRGTFTEGGSVVRNERDGAMLVGPVGRPYGWAFTQRSGDEPSLEREWGLNISGHEDPVVQEAYEAARTAPDPESARAAMAVASRRMMETFTEIYIEPIPVRVVSKGVAGVLAWPIPDEALAQASSWRLSDPGEAQ